MNLLKLFSFVVVVHLAVIGILLVQPGCQSLSEEPASAHKPAPTGEPSHAAGFEYSDNAFTSLNEIETPNSAQAQGLRRPPTRPTWNLNSSASQAQFASKEETAIIQPLSPSVSTSASSLSGSDYVVKRGDTLWGIAQKYKVSVQSIADASGIQSSSPLNVGQVLHVPGGQGMTSSVAPSTAEGKSAASHYVVKRGDTLSSIAHKHGTSVNSLKTVNGLTNDRIRVGQNLSIPGWEGTTVQHALPSSKEPGAQVSHDIYVVQRGDTLSKIASRCKVSASDLMVWNNIDDPRRLQVGQELALRSSGSSSSAAQPENLATALPSVSVEAPEVPVVETVEVEVVDEATFPEDFDDDSVFDLSDSIPVVPIESTQS